MSFEKSFYIVGGTVRRDAPCYLQRQADNDLYAGLMRGQFCYVLTARQMGKSSLMVRTATQLREDGVGVAVLDLTAIGQNLNAEQWYGGLLSQIGQQLDLEDELVEFWEERPKLGPLQRWMQAIRQVVLPRYVGQVVIFVDEIDAVRSLPFSTDEFFAGIREFYNHRTEDVELERLSFCLLGVASPSDLIRDTRTTPFNIGQRIELHDFTEAEAAPLAEGLRREEKVGAALLKRILYWTGGHPYLTQRLCQAVADDASVNDSGGVDRLCEEMFFTRRASERDDNLLFVRERMLRSEVDVAGLLSLYAQAHQGKRVVDDETNSLVSIVRLSGITRVEEGRLRVRNRIYARVFDREWVKAHMPDAEVRRQRAAYRRGLLRASAVAAVIIAVIVSLAFTAIKQRNRAEGAVRRADHNLQQANLSAEEARQALAEAERQRQRADEQRMEAENQQRQAEEQKTEAERQRREAVNQQQIAEEQRNRADEQRARAEQQEELNRRQLYAAHMNLAAQEWDGANIGRMQELVNNYWPKAGQEDLRGFEWYYFWRLCHSDRFTLPRDKVSSLNYYGRVSSVAFSPDGKKLATAGSYLKLWDAATGRELTMLKGSSGFFPSVAFSPDGQKLAAAFSHVVKLWNLATGQELATLRGHAGGIMSVVFSPDGKRLASGSVDRTVKLWDVTSGQELSTLKGYTEQITSVAFSPDGKRLASGSNNNIVRLWDVATGQVLTTLSNIGRPAKLVDVVTGQELDFKVLRNEGQIFSVAFSPDGKRLLASGGSIFGLAMWDVITGQVMPQLTGHPDWIFSIAFSSDGKRMATGGYGRAVKLWDVATWQVLTTIKAHGDRVDAVAFSPDGKRLATGGGDGVARVWDIVSAQEAPPLRHEGAIRSVAFSSDGKKLVSGSADHTMKLWEVSTGKELAIFKGHTSPVWSAAFSPDGKILASGSGDHTLRLWDVATAKELTMIKGHAGEVRSVAFSADGKKLATGSADRTVRLWDVATSREIATLKGHPSGINSVAFSPDGKILASGGGDGTVRLWDVTTGQELAILRGHDAAILSVTFSPDGKKLASTGFERLVKLWDVGARQELANLEGHGSLVTSLSFSPDGRRLASGGGDRTVKLWDVDKAQELTTLKMYPYQVNSVAFSPDGKTLALGVAEGGVRLLRAATEQEVLARGRDPQPIRPPQGWLVAGNNPGNYGMRSDLEVRHKGSASGYIKSVSSQPQGFGTMMQKIKADDYRGKRVRLVGYVKGENIAQYAGLWLRVDGPGYILNFDNMENRPIKGTTDWKKYEVVLDVPEESIAIAFGILLGGEGQAWVDDLQLEVVGQDVPTTGYKGYSERRRDEFLKKAKDERARLEEADRAWAKNLPAKPVNLDFEGHKP